MAYARIAVVLTAVLAGTAAAEEKAKIEIRWVESKPIKDVTEDKGFQTSCDPDDIMYLHKKPAITLTAADVSKVELKTHDLTKNGLGVQHSVEIHLTKTARATLAATVDGKQMRTLSVLVDGKRWGTHRYEIDKEKPHVPDQARAESFTPTVGFFSNEGDAQRVVDGLK